MTLSTGDVMSARVIYVTSQTSTYDAIALALERGIRHLVVLDEAELVGVLCLCDLRKSFANTTVRKYMKSPVLCVHPETSAQEAAWIMKQQRIGCLPVVASGTLAGIVTRHDLRLAGLAERVPPLRECASCKRHHEVVEGPEGASFCRDCLERGAPASGDDETGEGD